MRGGRAYTWSNTNIKEKWAYLQKGPYYVRAETAFQIFPL